MGRDELTNTEKRLKPPLILHCLCCPGSPLILSSSQSKRASMLLLEAYSALKPPDHAQRTGIPNANLLNGFPPQTTRPLSYWNDLTKSLFVEDKMIPGL